MMTLFKTILFPLVKRWRVFRWSKRGWFPWRGTRVYAPPGAHLLCEVAHYGDYERAIIQVIETFARPGTVVIDVGANLGLVSLAVLKTNEEVTVHAYEPSINSLVYLKKTWAGSGCKNRWHLHETACADQAGLANFHLAPPSLGAFDGLSISKRVPTVATSQVQLVRLDDEWLRWSSPAVSVVKIDVEGAEGRVCAGMERLIAACRPAIIMEWNLVNLEANKADPMDLFSFANRHSLRIFDPVSLVPIISLHWVRLLLSRGQDTFLLLPEEMAIHGDNH